MAALGRAQIKQGHNLEGTPSGKLKQRPGRGRPGSPRRRQMVNHSCLLLRALLQCVLEVTEPSLTSFVPGNTQGAWKTTKAFFKSLCVRMDQKKSLKTVQNLCWYAADIVACNTLAVREFRIKTQTQLHTLKRDHLFESTAQDNEWLIQRNSISMLTWLRSSPTSTPLPHPKEDLHDRALQGDGALLRTPLGWGLLSVQAECLLPASLPNPGFDTLAGRALKEMPTAGSRFLAWAPHLFHRARAGELPALTV